MFLRFWSSLFNIALKTNDPSYLEYMVDSCSFIWIQFSLKQLISTYCVCVHLYQKCQMEKAQFWELLI